MTTPAAEEEKPLVAGHKGRKMSPAQWSEAILLWKQGETTLPDLSRRYGISIPRLREKFKQVGAKKGELIERQQRAQEAAVVLEPSEHAKRVFDTKNETYLLVTQLRRLTGKQIADCLKAGQRLGTIINDIKAIKLAVETVGVSREQAYEVLGIRPGDEDDDKKLPDLNIRGLTQEEVGDLQAESMDDAAAVLDQILSEDESLQGDDDNGDDGDPDQVPG